ncbi:hypothetical protein HDF24_01880 [Mucilaginibacter sp. X4EP1]|uniref:hypothetical protein n=1 Tax=Mucilaginibacter sp. X4EP1 TaxID=2723092 RepID=UPI0021694FA5|nr:hypothetical protein [Mucilaginibacter sp. X4EP1]MCS3811763.1 hypothetical protein [Mucilaginibacter sp. X4EP1]
MKAFFTGIAMILCMTVAAQKITPLTYVENGAVLKPNETIIYGSFLRKPGIWYDSDLHLVIIKNMETKELFSVPIETHSKAGKESVFCFYAKPGSYKIIAYRFEKAKWYGGLITTTLIFKNIDYNINLKAKIDSGLIKKEDLSAVSFNIPNTGLFYVGKWHFETGTVFFTDEKVDLDKKMPKDFYFLYFNNATTIIPD